MKKTGAAGWRNRIAGFLLGIVLFSSGGCIYLVVGGVGVLGGYVISPDTIEGVIENHGFDEVFEAAVDVVSVMGVVEEQNDVGGIIIAKAQATKVTITVLFMSENSTRITVKARKAFMPKIKVAQDIFTKIEDYVTDNVILEDRKPASGARRGADTEVDKAPGLD